MSPGARIGDGGYRILVNGDCSNYSNSRCHSLITVEAEKPDRKGCC